VGNRSIPAYFAAPWVYLERAAIQWELFLLRNRLAETLSPDQFVTAMQRASTLQERLLETGLRGIWLTPMDLLSRVAAL